MMSDLCEPELDHYKKTRIETTIKHYVYKNYNTNNDIDVNTNKK